MSPACVPPNTSGQMAGRLAAWVRHGLVWVALALSGALAHADSQSPLKPESGFAPMQDTTVWPLEISQGYPWVRGQVGDAKGVFLLDTGTPWGLLLNRARVDLPEVTFILVAQAGSGQRFDLVRAARMPPVLLHGQRWADVRDVYAGDLGFIEAGTGIGPLLGFIGAHFFEQSALTLDYARRVAVIRQTHPGTGVPLSELPREMVPSAVAAKVSYQGSSPSAPRFDAVVGNTPVRVMLDSGNPRATLNAQWLAALRSAGAAKPFGVVDEATTYSAPPLTLGAMSVPLVDVVGSGEAISSAEQSGPPLLKIGFTLLSRYGVTWNYPQRSMTFFGHP